MAAVHFATIAGEPDIAHKVYKESHIFTIFVPVITKLYKLILKILEFFSLRFKVIPSK